MVLLVSKEHEHCINTVVKVFSYQEMAYLRPIKQLSLVLKYSLMVASKVGYLIVKKGILYSLSQIFPDSYSWAFKHVWIHILFYVFPAENWYIP